MLFIYNKIQGRMGANGTAFDARSRLGDDLRPSNQLARPAFAPMKINA